MTRYAILYSTRTMKSAVHAPGCACLSRPATIAVPYLGDSPEHALRRFREDEDADARGLPATTVAACAKKLAAEAL